MITGAWPERYSFAIVEDDDVKTLHAEFALARAIVLSPLFGELPVPAYFSLSE